MATDKVETIVLEIEVELVTKVKKFVMQNTKGPAEALGVLQICTSDLEEMMKEHHGLINSTIHDSDPRTEVKDAN